MWSGPIATNNTGPGTRPAPPVLSRAKLAPCENGAPWRYRRGLSDAGLCQLNFDAQVDLGQDRIEPLVP
jgi:hypothetical protein